MRKLLLSLTIPILLSVSMYAQSKKPWDASLVAYPAASSTVSVTFRSLTGSGAHVPDNGIGLAVSPPPPAGVSLIISVVTDDSVDHVSGNYFPDQSNPSLMWALNRDSDVVTPGVRISTWSIHGITAVGGAVLGGAYVKFSGIAGPKIMSLTEVSGLLSGPLMEAVSRSGKGTPTSTGNMTLHYGPAFLWATLGMQSNDDTAMGTWVGFTQVMRYALYNAPGGKAEALANAYMVADGAGSYSAGTQ